MLQRRVEINAVRTNAMMFKSSYSFIPLKIQITDELYNILTF